MLDRDLHFLRDVVIGGGALTMFADHEAYIAKAPEELRPLLVRLRTQLARALPDAEEVIAYKMPGFRIGQSIVAGYAAFSKQCGLYLSPSAITAHAADIAKSSERASNVDVLSMLGATVLDLANANRDDLLRLREPEVSDSSPASVHQS